MIEVDGDHGYRSTGRFIGEAALSLAELQGNQPGGGLTPATALGASFVDRVAHAGATLSIALTSR